MGMFVTIGFCCWVTLSVFVHIVGLGKEDSKKTCEMLNWIMYLPSRLSFLLWGPWLAGECGRQLSEVNDNIDKVDNLLKVNSCLDKYSEIDVDTVADQLYAA